MKKLSLLALILTILIAALVSCGKCDSECPTGAIRNGRIGSSCIRCQRCVHICPEHALEAKPRLVLKKYLDKNLGRSNEPIIYL